MKESGFVFSVDDPFFGIDLDACRDPTTGKLTDWAQKSWTVSPAIAKCHRRISVSSW